MGISRQKSAQDMLELFLEGLILPAEEDYRRDVVTTVRSRMLGKRILKGTLMGLCFICAVTLSSVT